MAADDRVGPETLLTQRFGREVLDSQHGALPCGCGRQTPGLDHSVTCGFEFG